MSTDASGRKSKEIEILMHSKRKVLSHPVLCNSSSAYIAASNSYIKWMIAFPIDRDIK
jgi:hypothetical protein